LRWRKDAGLGLSHADDVPHTTLTVEMTVEEVLGRWPGLASVFIRRRMACVGCAMARFERLSDVARIYGVSPRALRSELRHAVRVLEPVRRARRTGGCRPAGSGGR
jgi:hybrid cluster-associated redox disulfide protein